MAPACSVEDRLRRRNTLIELYSFLPPPIAYSIWRALPPSFGLDDLEQIGMLGLIQAAGTFESYARQKIRGAILDAVRIEYPEGAGDPLPEGLEIPDKQPSIETLLIAVEMRSQLTDVRVLRRLKQRVAACRLPSFGEADPE